MLSLCQRRCSELYCPIYCTLRAEDTATPYRTAYATYISKYLSGMDAAAIKPWAITPQNEPQACKNLMESMSFTADIERDFIGGQLGPVLHRDHPDVKILVYDHNKDNVVKYADTILSDATAAQYSDGVAFHWYASHDYFDHLDQV